MSGVAARLVESCIFCKIIRSEIPSFKLIETNTLYSFLDIGPISKGHSLIIPKYHGERLHDIPDEFLTEVGPVAKKIALALGVENYNLLQNNGAIAHQVVPHVHFHVIPKTNEAEGLQVGWPAKPANMDELKAYWEELKAKL